MKDFEFENYFFEEEVDDNKNKKLILIIYDIVCNKRRTKFVKLLESYGVRVQKSAFEAIITISQYNKLIQKIPMYIASEDNVRVYKLKVNGEVLSWGSGMTEPEEIIII